jgi:hypothetical protein
VMTIAGITARAAQAAARVIPAACQPDRGRPSFRC